MYYDYFGLKQPPFRITPDTNLFFPGGERGAVLDALIFAINNGEGIIKVVGEVGSGKTMLCRMLQKELPASVEIVYLANPSLSPENILQAIAFELKLPVETDSSKLMVMHKIQEYLINKHAQNQQVVVFVEEAQGMPLATLEEIRLLSNLETNQNKLLQIILFGQPELDQNIGQRNIRQLKERITYSFQLNPFRIGDIKEYINSRLRFCGYRADDLFSDAAFRAIARYSSGLVRRINILADKAMLAAYAGNTNRITLKHVRQAARDSEFLTQRWRYWLPSSILVIALSGALAYWHFHDTPGAGVLAETTPRNSAAGADPAPVTGTIADPAGNVARGPRVTTSGVEPEPVTGGIPGVTADTAPVTVPSVAGVGNDPALQRVEPPADPVTGAISGKGASGETASGEDGVGTAPEVADVAGTSTQSEADKKDLDGRLMGLNTVFRLQDMGDSRLSEQEQIQLRRQLKKLPPEEMVSQGSTVAGGECKLCWSIIYRPLVRTGNL